MGDDVYMGNANVKWMHGGLEAPLNARMTFIYRRDEGHANGWCIFELHSSSMPEINTDLKAISGGEPYVSGNAAAIAGVEGNEIRRLIVGGRGRGRGRDRGLEVDVALLLPLELPSVLLSAPAFRNS